MERVIKVTGKGSISVSPDITQLNLNLTGVAELYNVCLENSVMDLKEITDCLKAYGFKRKDLKTSHFSINTYTEGYYDKNNHYQTRDAGFKYDENLKLSFPNDNKLLGKLLYALSRASSHPKISISYTVSDTEGLKNALLANAVKDAKKKAIVLSDASSVTLGDIQTIDYSFASVHFETREFNLMNKAVMMDGDAGFDVDLEPDDISVTDTVTLVYSIV